MNKYLIIVLAVAAGTILTASTALTATMAASEERVAMDIAKNMKYNDYKDGVLKVKAGGGGVNAPLTKFFPQVAKIKVGESVVWSNPTRVPEPHAVTFVLDKAQWSDIVVPFTIANSTAVTPLAPGNSEAMTFPGPVGKTAMVGANGRNLNPVAIASDGTVMQIPPNSTYELKGDEKYVNSGWMWPQGQTPAGAADITSFAVKFQKEGTYDYICSIHPWMTGQVIVN